MAKLLTRRGIYNRVSKESGLSLRDSKKMTNAIFKIIAEHLASGGNVIVRGFGTFKVKPHKAMVGRCPCRPDLGEYVIPAHNKVVFVPYDALRNKVIKLPIGV